jgi:hypothetical protein
MRRLAQPYQSSGGSVSTDLLLSAFPALLSEHAGVERKPFGALEIDLWEVRVRGVQQDIPFTANCCGRYKEGDGFAAANPFISESPQGFVSGYVPTRRKGRRIKLSNRERIGNFSFDRHKIRRYQIGLQVHKCLNSSERKRCRGVDHAEAAAVPASAVEASTFADCSFGRVPAPANSP